MNKREETTLNNRADHFDNEIFLALFRKGADEYLENDLLIDGDNIDKESQISEVADKRIQVMIKQAIRKEKSKRAARTMPKILALFLAVLFVFIVAVMSVDALRVPFLNLFVHTEEKITDINFNTEQMGEGESFEDVFSYIPIGFELVSEEMQGRDVSLLYVNQAGERIVINIHYDGSDIGLDTEGSHYNKIMIKEQLGFYSSKNGFTNLVITKDGYAYTISSTIKLPEIIKIAENIK